MAILMKVMRVLTGLSLVLALMTAQAERGEKKQVFGDYEVHYIGLNSSFLTPEVAKIYEIPRSGTLGYLSISLLKKPDNQRLAVPVNAKVTGTIRNLIGQSRTLDFRQVQESSGVYYISTFRFDEGDMYNFKLSLSPMDAKQKQFDVKFSQRFYQE